MKEYIEYKCSICKKVFIVLAVVKSNEKVQCPYGHKGNIYKLGEMDNFQECMKHSSFKRVNGAIREIK